MFINSSSASVKRPGLAFFAITAYQRHCSESDGGLSTIFIGIGGGPKAKAQVIRSASGNWCRGGVELPMRDRGKSQSLKSGSDQRKATPGPSGAKHGKSLFGPARCRRSKKPVKIGSCGSCFPR